MVGLKLGRWTQASIAGLIALTGCVDRAYDFGDGGFDPDPDPNPDPTSDPNPDPTSDPNPDPDPDPTTDPDPDPPPPDNPGPPQLLDVQFIDEVTLQLIFSEGIAPATAVDPRQFRLSGGFSTTEPEQYGFYGTFYQEIGQWIANGYCEDCYEYCDKYYDDGGGYYCPKYCQYDYCYGSNTPVRVQEIIQVPERPDTIWLSLDRAMTSQVCDNVNGAPPGFTAALFLHYTASGAAPITDNSTELLASIAEQWALEPETTDQYTEGYFPDMNPFLPIPCTF